MAQVVRHSTARSWPELALRHRGETSIAPLGNNGHGYRIGKGLLPYVLVQCDWASLQLLKEIQ